MVTEFGVSTPDVTTVFILHELLEAISSQHLVFLVVSLVFFCKESEK